MNKGDFFFPRSQYRGVFTPELLVFNANLQEFSQRINYICNLEANGKLTPEEAYNQIKALWKQLKRTKKQLGVSDNPFQNEG